MLWSCKWNLSVAKTKQNKTKQPPQKTLTDVEDKDKVEDRMGAVLIQDHMPWLPGHLHRWDQQKANTICATDWTESSDKKCCVLDNHITAWTPFTDETSNWLVSFLVFWMGLWSPIDVIQTKGHWKIPTTQNKSEPTMVFCNPKKHPSWDMHYNRLLWMTLL